MNFVKLKKNDFIFISITLVILLLSIIFSIKYHHIAFPGQSISFDLSKETAINKADSLIAQNGIQRKNFQHTASTFTYPQNTKIFIEKELGIQESHKFFGKSFNIWQWSVRFFNSLEKEEVFVNFTTTNELRYFKHIIPEEQALNSVSSERAEQTARDFIHRFTDNDLDKWELKDKSTESKKSRVDYSFTYKKSNVEIYGAHFEIEIVVKGDKVGYYNEYLKLPEYWERDYKKLRSQNEITSFIAMVGLILLGLSSSGFFIFFALKDKVNVKLGLIFGIITFAIYFISRLNTLPLSLYWYNTTKSFSSFYTDLLISDFINSLFYGMAVFFLAVSGDALYRQIFPGKLKLLSAFSLKGMKTKEFFFGNLVGFTTAFLFIAFQIIFYWVAERLGAWSPAQVTYSEIINTKFPWIFILFAGFIPAVTEEFCFRLYGIPLFQKFTRSKVFAIIITAIIWGFAHSNYPNQPFWIRGLEVSLFGVATGFIFVHFGIIATLVWHYTVDAFLTVLMFANTDKTSIIVSSVLAASIAIFLLLYNLFFYIKNKGFQEMEELVNIEEEEIQKEQLDEQDQIETISHITSSIPLFSKTQIYIIFVVLLILISFILIPVKNLGSYLKYSTGKQEIIETGKQFLDDQGFDPDRFRNAVNIVTDCNSNCIKYINDHTTIDSANFITSNYLPNIVAYKIRFYNENEKEEFHIYVHPMDNEVTAFSHILEEDAMSYNLTKELALIRVEQFLAKKNYNIEDFSIVESFSETLPNRTDHIFIYESIEGYEANIADARLRLTLKVKGDELGYFKSWYKIPEKWIIEHKKESNLDSIRKIVQFFIFPILLLLVLLKYKQHFNFQCIPWKLLIYITSILFVILFASNLLNIKNQFFYYDTTWSINNFIISIILSKFISSFFNSLLLFLILLIGFAFYGSNKMIKDIHQSQKSGFDILLSTMLSSFGLIAILIILKYIKGLYPLLMALPDIDTPNYLVENIFILKILVEIFLIGIISAIIFYSIGSIIFDKKILLLGTFVLAMAILPIRVDTLPEFLFSYFSVIIVILWLYVCHRFFLRKNLLAYLTSGLSFFTITTSHSLITTGNTKAIVAGYFLIGLFLMMMVWLLIKDKTNWYERILN